MHSSIARGRAAGSSARIRHWSGLALSSTSPPLAPRGNSVEELGDDAAGHRFEAVETGGREVASQRSTANGVRFAVGVDDRSEDELDRLGTAERAHARGRGVGDRIELDRLDVL